MFTGHRATYRVITEYGEVKFIDKPCYASLYTLIDILKYTGGKLDRFRINELSYYFPSINKELKTQIVNKIENFKELGKPKIDVVYVKATRDCPIDVIYSFYRILSEYPSTKDYVTCYEGEDDVIRSKREIGIFVDKTPVYIFYMLLYTVRYLDEKYCVFTNYIADILDYLTPEYGMLLLLLLQCKYCPYDTGRLIFRNKGHEGHSLEFLSTNRSTVYKKQAIDGILKGTFEPFFKLDGAVEMFDDTHLSPRHINEFWKFKDESPVYGGLPYEIRCTLEDVLWFINQFEKRGFNSEKK